MGTHVRSAPRRRRYTATRMRSRLTIWLLLVVVACGATWYVTSHGLPRKDASSDAALPAGDSSEPAQVPTLDEVEALRARAKSLFAEALGYIELFDRHVSHAEDAYRKSAGSHPPTYGRPSPPPWETNLDGILSRMGLRSMQGVLHPALTYSLQRTEDALMAGDPRAAGRGWQAAQGDVRTFEGYLARVRKLAEANGLRK